MNLLGKYDNGNYTVSIYDDGTKIRENDLDFFEADFPESIDIKITNYCDMNCPFCHEGSTSYGKHGDILNLPFIDTLMPYTELAIGGGNPLAHPDLVEFLKTLLSKKIIPNITVNQTHFMQQQDLIKYLIDNNLIYGIGISYTPSVHQEDNDTFIKAVKQFPNAVIHVINGVISLKELHSIAYNDFKVLILGYKDLRRGHGHMVHCTDDVTFKRKQMKESLIDIIKMEWFHTISFDNLAIKQLDVQSILSKDAWEQFYMGDDGTHTMYIDTVSGEYAKSSVSSLRYAINSDIREMFNIVKSESR